MKKLLPILLCLLPIVIWGQETAIYADSIRTTFHIPELAYAVIDSKEILEIAVTGKHAIHLQDSATLDDRFHLGSNTKALTAFMIAKYVEIGKLHWDTKFFDVFPNWKSKSNKTYINITLKDLLSHRAGIPSFQGQPGFEIASETKLPDFKGSIQEKRIQYGQYVLTFEPEKINEEQPFIYSNAGYVLATLMLEKTTGKSWEQLVKKIFNKDLKLNVQFSWPENQLHKDTWGHSLENNLITAVPSNSKNKVELDEPAGDLNIKLGDYVKFIQMNLQGLNGQNNYLKSSTYHFLHNGIPNYAMGWFNISENGIDFSTHSGTVGTYYSQVQINRTKNRAYIVFANSFSDETAQGVRLLIRRLKKNFEK